MQLHAHEYRSVVDSVMDLMGIQFQTFVKLCVVLIMTVFFSALCWSFCWLIREEAKSQKANQ